MASGCGSGTHLLSIQVYPIDPSIAHDGTVYLPSGSIVQYQIIGWYSNRKSQSIADSQGSWSSSNTSVATVSSSGLATSVGPLGVATITVAFDGQSSTTVLSVVP
jgi:hypothetical protein